MSDISVGLGEIKISNDPGDVLIGFGLGSCIGVGMYDPIARIAGMLHAVLPVVSDNKTPSPKYTDSGVQMLLEQLLEAGALRSRIIVKMAGGANMLSSPGLSSTFDIGTRNVDSAYDTLKKLKLKISSESVGGQIGRTVRLYISDGRMTIRIMGGKERAI